MNTYWWYRPSRISLLVVLPIACGAFLASNQFYQRFGGFNAITPDDFLLVWLSILGFGGASWLGEVLAFSPPTVRMPLVREANYQMVLMTLTAIAVAATGLFLRPFLIHPQFVVSVFSGDPGALFVVRTYVDQISGVTSLGNLLNLVVVLFMIKGCLTGVAQGRRERMILAGILLMAAFKAVMHGERLALIELMVPLALVAIALRRRSAVWTLIPFVGVAGLAIFFTGTEYLRSWVAYYDQQSNSLVDFALTRLLGYYLTSINNGAYIYGIGKYYFFPIFTAEWLWHFPIPHLAEFLSNLTGVKIDILEILSRGQNVEFNNTSGVFAPLLDFGPVLGVMTWVVLGYLSGRLYRAFKEAHYLGLILFPTWYVGLLEMPRVFYWGDNRYFPTLVVSLLLSFGLLYLMPPARTRFVTARLAGNGVR